MAVVALWLLLVQGNLWLEDFTFKNISLYSISLSDTQPLKGQQHQHPQQSSQLCDAAHPAPQDQGNRLPLDPHAPPSSSPGIVAATESQLHSKAAGLQTQCLERQAPLYVPKKMVIIGFGLPGVGKV